MKKYRIALFALLVLFGLSAAACLASLVSGSLQDLSRQGRHQRLAAYQAQEEEFRRTRAEYDEWRRLPEDLAAFRRDQLISMDDFSEFRRELNLCLDDNGFQATRIAFQFGPAGSRMRRVGIQFSLAGAYRDIKKFLFDMEGKSRMHFFEHVELNAAGDKVTGSFGMEAYLVE
jgi:Tfp pilus assembly protein PilO